MYIYRNLAAVKSYFDFRTIPVWRHASVAQPWTFARTRQLCIWPTAIRTEQWCCPWYPWCHSADDRRHDSRSLLTSSILAALCTRCFSNFASSNISCSRTGRHAAAIVNERDDQHRRQPCISRAPTGLSTAAASISLANKVHSTYLQFGYANDVVA